MKLLTFLGVGKYDTTAYTWQGQEHGCSFAPVASCHFLQPDTLIVFLTEGAQDEVYGAFRAALPAELTVQPIPIPLGQDEQELWQIFEQVSSCVEPGEEVAFDITHGLRSFPLLGLLAAAFLRSGLRVSLRAVLYGAFDVRDKSVTPHRTPMFDLTPMLSLLEWAVASDRFNRTGDARFLASLLKQQQKALATTAHGDRELLAQAGGLGALAGKLTEVSQALRLIRPHQAMAEVAALPQRLAWASPALERSATTRPFSLLLESIAASYLPLALADASEPQNAWANIAKQRDMINWYLEREQWTQAATLAREWLVNWVMVQLGHTQLTQRSARERVEHVIGAETEDFVRAKQEGRRFVSMFLAPLPAVDEVLAAWSALTEVRNDINHAGMRENSKDPETLIKQISWCVERLNALPLGEEAT